MDYVDLCTYFGGCDGGQVKSIFTTGTAKGHLLEAINVKLVRFAVVFKASCRHAVVVSVSDCGELISDIAFIARC